jgi:hypothetical protein
MRDFIDNLKREAIERNYQIGFDKADDRKEQIIEFLKESGLAFKLDPPGNDLFAHAFLIDQPTYTFAIYIRFDRNFFTALAFKKYKQVRIPVDDEDLINKSLGPIFSHLENLGLTRVDVRQLMAAELGEGPLAAGLTGNKLFSVFIEDSW